MLFAQTITGVVSSKEGPLSGATVIVKETNKGAVTDFDGKYSLSDVAPNGTLVISFLGYITQEVNVAGLSVVNIMLVEDLNELNEVVVTALGIKRSKKALGYAVTEVKSDEVSKNGEINPISSLSGKIAGVNISQTASGPSGSQRVVIRGISSIQDNNQPLYIVDGIPINSASLGQADQNGGFDLGDSSSDINSEDIESISVLKGASASALYGSRALNGVILITTKSGKIGKKSLDIDFNSSVTIDQVSTKLDEYQTIYGQGINGRLPRVGQQASSITSAWGPKLDPSLTILQRDGTTRPYGLVKNNIQDFFNTGVTYTNSISLNSGQERGSFRFSYANVTNEDIIPNAGLEKNSFTIRAKNRLTNFLEVDTKASYITENVDNRPALTDNVNNIGNGLVGLAPNVDQAWLQNYIDQDGRYIDYTGNNFRANPYWTINKTFNKSRKNRLLGFVNLNFNLHENLKLRLKSGIDRYSFNFVNFMDRGTPTRTGGFYAELESTVQEVNHEALLTYSKSINDDWGITTSLGANVSKQESRTISTTATEIAEPGIANILNFQSPIVTPGGTKKEIQSVFGLAQISYKDFAFIDITARNDWSSTLPSQNNSFFYPSFSGSFVFTDAFNINKSAMTYGKIRASWAQVGGDTDPFSLQQTYAITGLSFGGFSQGQIDGNTIPNSNLKPQTTTSYEFGTDLRFLNNRIGIDFTYYNQTTDDQILQVEVPTASGFSSARLNSGALENKGIELLFTIKPIKTNNFKWDVTLNYSKIWNKVISLHEDIDVFTVANARWSGVTIVAFAGEEFGQIYGRGYKRDPQGNIVHDATTGLPLATDENMKIGNILPDWTGGVINTFNYKNFRLKAALGVSIGGDIYSITNRSLLSGGAHTASLGGRDAFNDWAARNEQERLDFIAGGGDPGDYVPLTLDGGYVGQGVKLVSTDPEGNETYEENDVIVNPQNYWLEATNKIPETNVYDASYVKLRELSLSYSLPSKYLSKKYIKGLTISVIGRNLFTFYKNVPNIDPESAYNNGNGQGLEYGSLPTRRNYGLNLSLKF